MAFHSLTFRTFVNATEDEEKVAKALRYACGEEKFSRSASKGFYGNPIVVLEAIVKKKAGIDSFFQRLGPDSIGDIIETLDRRTDEEGCVFLRLDKQDAYSERTVLSDGEDVIAVKGKVKAYPKTRARSIEEAAKYLGSFLC